MNNYHLYEEIGRGKLSVVYRGRHRNTTSYVAVKSLEKSRRDKVMVEARALSRLQHPNVVGFVNWYETRNHIWVILEYCAGGELSTLLKQDGMLPEEQLRLLGREICRGLLYVHCQGIIYADLKTCNVLFNENGELKLSDFGHAQHLKELSQMIDEKVPLPRRGTPNYMAPELFQQGGMHSFASDLWSCGCVLFELCMNRLPFQAATLGQIQQRVVQDPVPMLLSTSSSELRALVNSLLEKKLFDRITWPVLCEHHFWKDASPGNAQQFLALPPQPHLDALRCHSTTSPAIPVVSLETAVATASATATSPPQSSDGNSNASRSSSGSWQQRASRLRGRLRAVIPSGVYLRLQQLLSDANPEVRPISKNTDIMGVGEEVRFEDEAGRLPFAALGSGEAEEVEAFLTGAFRCLSKGAMQEQIRGLRYLEACCSCRVQASRTCDMRVADLVANSSLMSLLMQMLSVKRQPSSTDPLSTELKAQLLSLVGELLRHATYFEPDCRDLGLFDVLLEHLRPNSSLPLGRGAAAALGELLFFMAAQLTEAPMAQQGKWQPPQAVLQRVIQIATDEEEDVAVRHYLIQTMENISKQCPQVAREWFYSEQVVGGLVACLGTPVSEHLRTSCLEIICFMVQQASDEVTQSDGRLAGHDRGFKSQQKESQSSAAPTEREDGVLRQQAGEALSRGLASLSSTTGLSAALRLLACSLLNFEEAHAVWSCNMEEVVDLLLEILAGDNFSFMLKSLAAIDLALICLHDDWDSAMLLRLASNEVFAQHFADLAESKNDFVVRSVALVLSILDHTTMLLLQRTQEETQDLLALTASHDDRGRGTSDDFQHLQLLIHVVTAGLLCTCAVSLRTLPSLDCLWDLDSTRMASSNPVKRFQSLAATSTTGYCSKGLLMELEQLANDQEGIPNACIAMAQVNMACSKKGAEPLLAAEEEEALLLLSCCCRHLADLCIARLSAATIPFSSQSIAAILQVLIMLSKWRVTAGCLHTDHKSRGLSNCSDFIPRRLLSILRCALLSQVGDRTRGDREVRNLVSAGLEQLIHEGGLDLEHRSSTALAKEAHELLALARPRNSQKGVHVM